MAEPKTTVNFVIALGNGGDPEQFAHPCGANVRSFSISNDWGQDVMLDCENPNTAPTSIDRWLNSSDSSISLSGRVARASWPEWQAWVDGAVKNIEIQVMNNTTEAGGKYAMPAVISEFELGQDRKETVTFSATIIQKGARTYTAAS